MILMQFVPVISQGFFICLCLLSLCTSASYPKRNQGVRLSPTFFFFFGEEADVHRLVLAVFFVCLFFFSYNTSE